MVEMILKEEVIAACKEIGIDKIGFTTAEPFDDLKESLLEQQSNGHSSGFEHQVLDERLYPELIFDQPKSIISIALAYPSKPLVKAEREKGVRRGSFARASWGIDYHTILRDRLDQLVAFMSEKVPTANFKAMVDTGELMDTVVAQRAGLGFIGRNGLLITEEYGSYVYLGEIITDIEFEPDQPGVFGCGDCTRCVTACPTGALLGDGRLNAQVCLSYQTQTKGSMPLEFRRKIGSVIYGCDICQQACPYNRGIDFHHHPEMEPVSGRETPILQPMLSLSNREFKETFGVLAGSWRGKKPLQRNAIIALANYRDRTAVPELLRVMEEDVRPVIRGTAAWAIGQIVRDVNPELLAFFQEKVENEEDDEARVEMEMALAKLEGDTK